MESIQQRALRIIYPSINYDDALSLCQLSTLADRRAQLCNKFISKISQSEHSINFLVPRLASNRVYTYNLRPGVVHRPTTYFFFRFLLALNTQYNIYNTIRIAYNTYKVTILTILTVYNHAVLSILIILTLLTILTISYNISLH